MCLRLSIKYATNSHNHLPILCLDANSVVWLLSMSTVHCLSLHPTSDLQKCLFGAMSDQGSGDALLPGTGYSPDYGINVSADGDSITSSERSSTPAVTQSTQGVPKKKTRVWVVAMCALIACLASLVNGLMLSFSSSTLDFLSKQDIHSPGYIQNGSVEASLYGVCFFPRTLKSNSW